MIDKDKIFQLFVDGKEITDEKTKSEIQDFMNGPFAKIGMFVKSFLQNKNVYSLTTYFKISKTGLCKYVEF